MRNRVLQFDNRAFAKLPVQGKTRQGIVGFKLRISQPARGLNRFWRPYPHCTFRGPGNVQSPQLEMYNIRGRGGQWPVSMRSFKTAMSKWSMLQAQALLRGNELGLGAGHRAYCLVASALASCSRPKAQALSSSGPRPPRKMYNIGTPRYILATAPRICNYPHLRTGRVIVH